LSQHCIADIKDFTWDSVWQGRKAGQKLKREAKAKGLYLPGWVGFVTGHPVGILVFRAWMRQQTGH
jgi:hypothetical protein